MNTIPPEYLNQIVTGDARELAKHIPDESIDLVLTDPPYPDYYPVEYHYRSDGIDFLNTFLCCQFVFWTSKELFPLSFTARHVWDKKTGVGSMYEFIYERNGRENFKVYRHYLINSIVAASYTGDIFTGHPSQKPAALIREILLETTQVGDTVIDFFCGSGTVPAVCKMLGRNYVAFEIDPDVAERARERVRNTQPPLFVLQPEQQEMMLNV